MVFGQGENQPPARLNALHTTDEPIPLNNALMAVARSSCDRSR